MSLNNHASIIIRPVASVKLPTYPALPLVCSTGGMFTIAIPTDSLADPFAVPAELLCGGPGGISEVHFSSRAVPRLLPVRVDGRTIVIQWGAHRSDSRRLPVSGFVWLSTVQFGKWPLSHFEWVTIPSTRVMHNEVWYDTPSGIRGLLMPGANDTHSGWGYVLCEPATAAYQAMTHFNWQPIRARSFGC
jgi:hypothetical protein